MTQHVAIPGPAPALPLADLDRTTVRALADAGYLDHAAYVDIARARGWHDVGASTAPVPMPTARMAHQPERGHMVSVSHAITVTGVVPRRIPVVGAVPYRGA